MPFVCRVSSVSTFPSSKLTSCCFAALAAAGLLSLSAHAQTADAGTGGAAPETTLTAVTVQGARDSATEGTNSYTAGEMRTATRLGLTARETPQSTTVITHQRIEDGLMTGVADVVRSTPGLFLNNADGPGRPSFMARGFYVDKIMYDGLPSGYQGWVIGMQPNLAMFDRVEVVRGATGLVSGTGNPSAAINMVRKRPTRAPSVLLSATGGSWDDYRGEVDASGALNDSGSVRGRTVASWQKGGTFRTAERFHHGLLYGALEADLGSHTKLLAGVSHQDDYTNSFWGGLPLTADGHHMDLPRRAMPSNDWERKDQRATTVFADLEHRFGGGWKLHLAASKARQDATFFGTYLERSVDQGLRHSAYRADYVENQYGLDAFLSGPYTLLGRQHELAVGVSRRSVTTDTQGYDGLGLISSNIDLWHWNPRTTVPEPAATKAGISTESNREQGVNAMTRLDLAERLKLILGGRLDWYEYDDRGGGGAYKVTRNVTRYVGAIYDLDASHSAYASFTNVFQPQSARDVRGNILAPILGKNYELGVKGEYFGGALNASAALFQVDQANRAKTLTDQTGCPGFPAISCAEAAGLVRSKGIDLEVQGSLTPAWQVGAGYSYARTTYVRDTDPDKVGMAFVPDTPRQLLKLSTQYQMPGAWDQWRVGGSIYRQSAIYNVVTVPDGKTLNSQAAYSLLDLMASYRVSSAFDLQLNVNNVFDKRYYRAIGYDTLWGSTDTYGDPRKFQLTARYRF